MSESGAAVRIGGRFDVVRELGRGSSATVYLVRDAHTDRLVAVKVLHADLIDAVGYERFAREIRVMASLSHPNILPIYDVGRDADQPFFAMPYVEGWTLRQRITNEGPLPLAEVLNIARQLCSALAYAHARDVLHRDVKPENVLGLGGAAYLTDFGVAWALDAAMDLRLTSSGHSLGTPAYMSPEQVAADRTVDARSDQYSLSLVIYETLAGEPAFRGADARTTAVLRLQSDPTPLEILRPELPRSVTLAVRTALARAPDNRFPDVAAFERALLAGEHGAAV